MSAIDIRHDDQPIDRIIFASNEIGQRPDTALHLINGSGKDYTSGEEYIFIATEDDGEYIGIRRGDINNLIKALKKADELWS